MSSVLERRRENCSGVRRGVLFGAEGKIEMCSGLFCGLSVLVGLETKIEESEKYVLADYAQASYGWYCCHCGFRY